MQHLNPLKKCCEKRAGLRKGDTALKNGKFLQKFLVHYFLILTKTFLLRKAKMPRKVTLQINNEGLELLKKHSIRETNRIINTRYSMDLSPSTIHLLPRISI